MEKRFEIKYCHKCSEIAPFVVNGIFYCYECVHGTVKPKEKKEQRVKTKEELIIENESQRKRKFDQLITLYKKADEIMLMMDGEDVKNMKDILNGNYAALSTLNSFYNYKVTYG